jgi:DNA-binding NarL/FixJ family response regulator
MRDLSHDIAQDTAQPTDPHSSTILLVDDDTFVRSTLSACLQKAGYQVMAASNGREGLVLFEQASNSISLLVTDVEMPVMSGIELATCTTSACGGFPVLLISGRPLPPYVEPSRWEFLAKPFAPADLIQKVRQMLQSNGGPKPISSQPREPASPGARPRIIVADDHSDARECICGLLRAEYDVVAACANGASVLDKSEELQPDVVLLDIGMPDMNGFAVARKLSESMPSLPVLFVTQHAERSYVEEAFRIGVAGYVLKRRIVDELHVALQQVRSGDSYLSPSLRAR